MITYYTPPVSLTDALDSLADRMDRYDGRIGHVALANMMSAVVDGPGRTAWQPTSNPEMARRMQDAVVPDGFLSPVPTVDQVRRAAACARTN